jgi:glutaredoxin 3
MDEGADIQAYLAEKTGQRTVPNIFIKGQVRRPTRQAYRCASRPFADPPLPRPPQHVGGSDDLASAHSSGKLAKLIEA